MSHAPAAPVVRQPKPWGLLVEFDDPESLLSAAAKVRDAGYRHWDAFTPYPVHGLDDAMGLGKTPLPWLVFFAGVFGCFGAMLLMLFANWWDYAVIVSGKPFWSLPANIPVMFECTVLLAGITAFVSVFALSGLPLHHHPVFSSERFLDSSTDKFFIVIETADPQYDATRSRELAESLGGTHVELLED